MFQVIKEKIQSFRSWQNSEQLALVITLLAIILVLVFMVVIIKFVLPKTRLEIKLSGPEMAKVGEEVSYEVKLKNTGTVILKNPELVFHYPNASLPEKSLIETRRLEDLYPQQEKTITFKARLFGQEGEAKEFKTWLNYSPGRKKVIMVSKVASFSTIISQVPIDLVLDLPKKASVYPQDEAKFILRIRYFSFIPQTLSNLKLLVDFPADLTFQESNPPTTKIQKPEKPTEESIKEFEISTEEFKTLTLEFETLTLEPQTGKEVEITGTLPADYQTEKELDFKVKLLINLAGVDVLLKEESVKTITYKPSLSFYQKINNQEKYFPYPGERLYYQIYFKNLQNEPLRDLSLTTILEGNLFDLTTIEVPLGTFTKGANFISWEGTRVPELKYLTPGQEGKVEFWVSLKPDYQPKDLTETNALIKNRVISADFETEFRNRVNSLIKISQEGYFYDKYKFFENEGEHPPKVDKTTYYTIVWKLENYYNWLEKVQLKTTLPKGVSVRKIKNPKEGEINVLTYPLTEVIWEIDKVGPGKGTFEDPLLAAFQLAFTPDAKQKGKIAKLINEIKVSAKDQWTGLLLSASDKAIDTTLPDDPMVRGEGIIR